MITEEIVVEAKKSKQPPLTELNPGIPADTPIKILFKTIKVNANAGYIMEGEAQNIGNYTMKFILLRGHVYDSHLNLIGATSGNVFYHGLSEDLNPGQIGTFSLPFDPADMTSKDMKFYHLDFEFQK